MKKYIKIYLIILGIGILIGWWWLINKDKDIIYIDSTGKSPIEMRTENDERIYLRNGSIYALNDDAKKEFHIVNYTFHTTHERYQKLIFFNTPEEAMVKGFKPSPSFEKDYACFKAGKDMLECEGVKWWNGE